MKIENQVCSLDQSILLEELGIKGDSILFHVYPHMNSGWKVLAAGMFNKEDSEIEWHHAYTVSELQIMDGSIGNIMISERGDHEGKFYSDVDPSNSDYSARFKYYETMSEAFGDKLIRGLRKEYYTAYECNTRLSAQSK